jgi:hypothetical protein
MRRPGRLLAPAALGLGLSVASAGAQTSVSGALIERRTVRESLDREIRALGARDTWIGYRVPMVAGLRSLCCPGASDRPGSGGGPGEACPLDGRSGITMKSRASSDGSGLIVEPASELIVVGRLARGVLTRLRTFTPDCPIDATGETLVWFDGLSEDVSASWLAGLVDGQQADGPLEQVQRTALVALALHPGAAAARRLIDVARENPRQRLRGQALFWLAQRASDQAAATIGAAIEDDPDLEVRKQAVFALSQLPPDRGVPLLIDVARTHRHRDVRRQAMFWLGQSRDPRALAFFEEVLTAR